MTPSLPANRANCQQKQQKKHTKRAQNGLWLWQLSKSTPKPGLDCPPSGVSSAQSRSKSSKKRRGAKEPIHISFLSFIMIAVTRPNVRKSDIMKSVGDLQLQRDPYLNQLECRWPLRQ
ncbi:uncharacterized protein TrAtP1_002365 [Trichoderma atroviride]|uniref:uncharacterized protein n=1 Tax=Hypocrea atroviridis TaxID=63577 RepID=UPI00331F8EB2|nr:hypothetical protein TrAtP1_002365 [Trichoderma atroviride]